MFESSVIAVSGIVVKIARAAGHSGEDTESRRAWERGRKLGERSCFGVRGESDSGAGGNSGHPAFIDACSESIVGDDQFESADQALL